MPTNHLAIQRVETVEFDPKKKAHRIAYHKFAKRKSWSDAGIQFSPGPGVVPLVEQIRTALLDYYLSKEK